MVEKSIKVRFDDAELAEEVKKIREGALDELQRVFKKLHASFTREQNALAKKGRDFQVMPIAFDEVFSSDAQDTLVKTVAYNRLRSRERKSFRLREKAIFKVILLEFMIQKGIPTPKKGHAAVLTPRKGQRVKSLSRVTRNEDFPPIRAS